jgi:hypothetical protein
MFCYEFCFVQLDKLVNYVYRNSCFTTEFSLINLITTDSSYDRKWKKNSGGFFVKMLVKKLFNMDMQKRIEYFRS